MTPNDKNIQYKKAKYGGIEWNKWVALQISLLIGSCFLLIGLDFPYHDSNKGIYKDKDDDTQSQKSRFVQFQSVHPITTTSITSSTTVLQTNQKHKLKKPYLRRSLIEESTNANKSQGQEIVLNPAFTISFYPSSYDNATLFSLDAIDIIEQKLEAILNSRLHSPNSNSSESLSSISDESSEVSDLSSSYQSMKLRFISQSFSTEEDQTSVLHLQQTDTSIEIEFSTTLYFEDNDLDEDLYSNDETLKQWLLTSFDVNENGPDLINSLHETGLSPFRWLNSMNISLPVVEENEQEYTIIEDFDDSDTTLLVATVPEDPPNKAPYSIPSDMAIIIAVVGCILAGALSAYLLLFGKVQLCTLEPKSDSTITKKDLKSDSLPKVHSNQNQQTEQNVTSQSSVDNSSKQKYLLNTTDMNKYSNKYHPNYSSRRSRSSSTQSQRKQRRRKNKSRQHRDAYSMSSISSGSLMTISEDDHDLNSTFDESLSDDSIENDDLERVNEAFKTLQEKLGRGIHNTTNGKPDVIPNEIVYTNSSMSATGEKKGMQLSESISPVSQESKKTPGSFFFRSENYRSQDESKTNDGDLQTKRLVRSNTFETISTLGASQYDYDADVQSYEKLRERERNKCRKHPIPGAEIPPHPRGNSSNTEERIANKNTLVEIIQQRHEKKLEHTKKKNRRHLKMESQSSNRSKTLSKKSQSMKSPNRSLEPRTFRDPDNESENDTREVSLSNDNKPSTEGISPQTNEPSSSGSSGHEEVTIVAPKGRIGVFIVVLTRGQPCVVHSVKEESAIYDKIFVGDVIIKIDGIDVTKWSAIDVAKFLALRASNPERVLTVRRHPISKTESTEVQSSENNNNNNKQQNSVKNNQLYLRDDMSLDPSIYSDGGGRHTSKFKVQKLLSGKILPNN